MTDGSMISTLVYLISRLRKVPSTRYDPLKPLYPRNNHFCEEGTGTGFVTNTAGFIVLRAEFAVNVKEIEKPFSRGSKLVLATVS
jgi:hypothetical protein